MNGRERLITFSDNDAEAQPLLIDDDEDINSSFQHYYPALKPVIMRGVAMHLAEWPSHLFSIFTTVCIVSAAFIALAFVTIILFAVDRKPSVSRNVEIEDYPNVYCIKHASHAWTQDELCAIESSAREFPELHVYLVNLQRHVPETSSAPVNTSLTLNFGATEDAVSALTERYTNVRSIDIVASTLFRKSILGEVYTKFDGKLLEIAVKSQLLWTYAGIAVNPLQIDGIKYLKDYLCRSNELCKPMKNAAISTDGSLQVSPVPCHAFFEVILKKLAAESRDEKKCMRDAYNSFCAGREKCIGVEILNNISWNISHRFTCPVIFPEGVHRS
ncbi:uncharacterized protein LOC107048782 isoform X2 [Diachasma alloeum]|uniref:uncharacterized protein LOC107048782 isoform X2 n=1 Tax=Diachasma alloeum TaxID=454923 RepID=UPI0007382316|nr:uncharacterized protein LOC107048782 isoform X2 [Diachasma alloeum]